MKLSIIIPAYNEEKRIVNTLLEYHNFFYKKLKKDFEIIVIPNNCKDKTPQVVRNISKKYEQIKSKNMPYFCGKGGAVIEGFKTAKGELIGFVDADNSTKPETFYELYKKIEDSDCIIASRWINGAKVSPKQTITRRIASRTFNVLVRILFGIKISDTQCGAKLFKREPLLEVLPKLVTTRWAFDVDLLYKLKLHHYKIKEIPTTWSDNIDSKLNVKKAAVEMFLAITRLRLVHSPFKFIVKVYDKTLGMIFK